MTEHRQDSGPLRVKTSNFARKPGGATSTTVSPSRATAPRSGAAVKSGSAASRSSGTLPAQATKTTPMRQAPHAGSDRRGPTGNGPRSAKSGLRLGLRAKFMLVLSGTAAVVLILLGIMMSISANKYLGSQKRHDGVEVALMSAQVLNVVTDAMERMQKIDESSGRDYGEWKRRITDYLQAARTWGALGSNPSDILAVKFNLPAKHSQLSSSGFGPDEQSGATIGMHFSELFIPKSGETIALPEGIEVFTGIRQADGVSTPIYRFKVALSYVRYGGIAPQDGNWSNTPYVNVDINASSVTNAQSNLFVAIFMGVILAIAITVGVANWLASNITHPVQLLVKDMKQVAEGDLKHETYAHSSDEIGILATEFNRMTANLRAAQSALVEQEKAEYELSIAREVQRQLLPANSPDIPGFQCASYYLGAKAVSGDYFDFIELGDGLWGFIIADVSGKGIPGSMVMAVTRTIVRLIAVQHGARASETLKNTNRLIARQIKRGMFVTSFYAVLDTRTGQLSYACAGHNPMIIYRAATRGYELAAGKGIALGFNEGPIFDKTIELHQTVLNRGDGIVLYTDGFPEAMNASNEEFGDDRFYELVPKYAQGDVQTLINGLVGEIAKHRGDAEQSDDLTLLTVRRN